jgi:hypothetical protein
VKKLLLQLEAVAPFALPVLLGAAVLVALLYVYSELKPILSGESKDPGGSDTPNAGLLDAAANQLELGRSSLSYTGAAQQVVSHPIDSLFSYLGIDGGGTAPAQSAAERDWMPW